MGFFEYLSYNAEVLLFYGQATFLVVLYSVAIATAIGVLLGVLLHTNRMTPESWTKPLRMGTQEAGLLVTAALLTFPSFAFFASMQPFLGTGALPTIVVLSVYGIYPVLRNIVAGLSSVDPAVLESAKGMGMSSLRRSYRVLLPLAWPVIISGIRVATMILISISVVAALFRGPGLGTVLADGLSRIGSPGAFNDLLAGTLGCLVVAAAFQLVFFIIRRFTTPRGIRV